MKKGYRQSSNIEDLRDPKKARISEAKTRLYTRLLDYDKDPEMSHTPLNERGKRLISKTKMSRQALPQELEDQNSSLTKNRKSGTLTPSVLAKEYSTPQKKFKLPMDKPIRSATKFYPSKLKTEFFKHKVTNNNG